MYGWNNKFSEMKSNSLLWFLEKCPCWKFPWMITIKKFGVKIILKLTLLLLCLVPSSRKQMEKELIELFAFHLQLHNAINIFSYFVFLNLISCKSGRGVGPTFEYSPDSLCEISDECWLFEVFLTLYTQVLRIVCRGSSYWLWTQLLIKLFKFPVQCLHSAHGITCKAMSFL